MPSSGKAEAECRDAEARRAAGPVTRRLVYALTLLPIVPSVAILCTVYCDEQTWIASSDELTWFQAIMSVLFVALTVMIWRAVVVWTLGCKMLTALVSLIPFVQVVWAQPLWASSGCMASLQDDFLRMGQHQIGMGVWIWCSIWVWWGWEKLHMSTTNSSDKARPGKITATARRLAASIGTIPFVFGVFVITAFVLDDPLGLSDPLAEAYALTAIVAVVLWVLIWRKPVAWDAGVKCRTALWAVLLLGVPIAALKFIDDGGSELAEATLSVLPVVGWGVWMALTVARWPALTTRAEATGAEPRCMQCGYLLIGLTATRCPECGDEPTIDELWAASTGEGL